MNIIVRRFRCIRKSIESQSRDGANMLIVCVHRKAFLNSQTLTNVFVCSFLALPNLNLKKDICTSFGLVASQDGL